jgi:hypothetical protein
MKGDAGSYKTLLKDLLVQVSCSMQLIFFTCETYVIIGFDQADGGINIH